MPPKKQPSPAPLADVVREAMLRIEEEMQAKIRANLAELTALELQKQTLKAQMDQIDGLRPTGHSSSLLSVKKPLPRGFNRGPKITEETHPMPAKVGNVKEWARLNGWSYSYAKSWYRTGNFGRAIPHVAANALLRDYGIPLSAWKNGITPSEEQRHAERLRAAKQK